MKKLATVVLFLVLAVGVGGWTLKTSATSTLGSITQQMVLVDDHHEQCKAEQVAYEAGCRAMGGGDACIAPAECRYYKCMSRNGHDTFVPERCVDAE